MRIVFVTFLMSFSNQLLGTDEACRDKTPLAIAAKSGHEAIVKFLTTEASGVDIGKADHHGMTPLNWAAGAGHTEVIRLLLDAGAEVNRAAMDGDTPLISAITMGRTGVVRLLLEAGADANQANMRGEKPFLLATESLKALLEDYGASE
ncbi:MAG: ankyrin repeat domain-containing protein [Deltaproteobacteria bacterium]|nr:ankyrin repeat domain-containing protein [Deltaproteobacteria bacterium]